MLNKPLSFCFGFFSQKYRKYCANNTYFIILLRIILYLLPCLQKFNVVHFSIMIF